MKRRTFLRSGALGATGAVAGCPTLRTSRDSAGGPPRLSVDGRWLTGPDGTRTVLRGVNLVDPWWGVEYADTRGKGYWETLALALDGAAGWHSHVVRFPVEPRTIDAIGVETLLADYLDRAVAVTREAGVYAIIDFHAIDRYDTVDVDRRVREFWSAVAPRYADESHVLYELFNEPTEPAQNGLASWRNWRDVATPWVELVRSEAPETPIIVGSPRWSSMVRYAPAAPFADDNVVYSAHVFPSWDADSWERSFGSPALEVPVFVTEWGYVGERGEHTEPHMIGSTSGFGEPFRAWLDRHDNVSWCAWTFDSVWMPRMFETDWTLLGGEDYMGEFTKRWLAETRGDHWPPGRSVTETPRATAPTRPGPVPGLEVTERSPTSIAIAWDGATDPDGDVVQYRIAVDGETVQVRRPSVRTADLTGLEPGQKYLITVTAVDGTGRRGESRTLTAATLEATDPMATIPRATTAPTVDGAAGEPWTGVATHAVDNVLMPPPSGGDDLGGAWQALWDEAAIYYRVAVTDPEANTDSDAEHQNDNLEVYLDPDHSRGRRYDGENDAQLLVERGTDVVIPGANSVDYPNAAVGQVETDGGWAAELKIPWRDAGVSPAAGTKIGTDVHVTDDVDGGDRDAKLAWFATTDVAWQRPDTFATVVLGE